MEPRHFACFSIVSSWILVLFLPCVCRGMTKPTLTLDSNVFVAFSGEDLSIKCTMTIPVNQTGSEFSCFNTTNESFHAESITATGNTPQTKQLTIPVKNVTSSGVYYCKFKNTEVHWFVRVRAKDYWQMVMRDYTDTEFIIVAAFTSALLLFSVFGSVYVFRGDWKAKTTECGDTNEAEKQKRDDSKKTGIEEDNVDVTTAQSTSFYASLEPRPRSIYDVLDHSAANAESGQNTTKSKQKQPPEMAILSAEPQEEGIFESVYENF